MAGPFIAVNDDVDTFNPSNSDDLMIPFKNLMNENYCRELSIKLRKQFKIQRDNGEFIANFALFGYKRNPENKHELVIDEYPAEVVKGIYEMFLQGYSPARIAAYRNAHGIIAPYEYKKQTSNYVSGFKGAGENKWNHVTIRRILTNTVYYGELAQVKRMTHSFKVKKVKTLDREEWSGVENTHEVIIPKDVFETVEKLTHEAVVVRVGSNRVKMIPEEEQIIMPDTHEAIISREAFYQARLVINSNTKSKKSTPTNPFSGYLVCGCCGNRLSKGKTSNKNWLCTSARYTDETECKHVRANEELLRSNVIKAIKVQCDLADANVQAAKSIQKNENKRCEAYEWEIKSVERSIADCESEVMQALERYYADGISQEDFLNIKASIIAKKTELSTRLVELQEKVESIKKQITENQDLEITARTVAEHGDIDSLDCGLMKALIRSIIIYPNNAVHINWNFSL